MTASRATSVATFFVLTLSILLSETAQGAYTYDARISSLPVLLLAIATAHFIQLVPHRSKVLIFSGAVLYALSVCVLFLFYVFIITYVTESFPALYKLTNAMGNARFFTTSLFIPTLLVYVIIRLYKAIEWRRV